MHIIASFGIFDQWKNSIFDTKIEEIWLGLKIGSALNQFKVQIIIIYNLNPSIWQWSFFLLTTVALKYVPFIQSILTKLISDKFSMRLSLKYPATAIQ